MDSSSTVDLRRFSVLPTSSWVCPSGTPNESVRPKRPVNKRTSAAESYASGGMRARRTSAAMIPEELLSISVRRWTPRTQWLTAAGC